MKHRAIGFMAGLVTLLTGPTWAQASWDAVADFRLDANPAGAWSYQWQAPRGLVTLMEFQGTDCAAVPGVSCWRQGESPGLEHLPMVGINTTGAPIQYGTVVVPVDVLVLHPGDSSDRAVVTWTAPTDGTYLAAMELRLISAGPDGVFASVHADGLALTGKRVTVGGLGARFQFIRTLRAGQTLSFVAAPLLTHARDLTTLRATVKAVEAGQLRLLNDTGITDSQCFAVGRLEHVSCLSPAALRLNDQQDGMVGRDVANHDDTDGMVGFSFSLVPRVGGGFHDKTECVKDEVTGLIWEGKTATGERAGSNGYTNWSDGRAGDASAYVAYVNDTALCGFTNWRLPDFWELQSIVNYGVSSNAPTIDANWFPNTVTRWYWTSSTYVRYDGYAWYVNFAGSREISTFGRAATNHVRLVR
jgi:Protein of unknown function (DUF1566)